MDPDEIITDEGVTPEADELPDNTVGASADHASGAEDGDAEDDAATEAALLTGFRKITPTDDDEPVVKKITKDGDDEEDLTDTLLPANTVDTDVEEEPVVPPVKTAAVVPPTEEDPDIPGLGKASVVKAQLARLEAMDKQMSSVHGNIGQLRQLVTSSAQQGKPITAQDLEQVSNEFGAEYAQALATDLNKLGMGGRGGASVDADAIERIVGQRIESTRREFETRLVQRDHPDANDHFALPKVDAQGNPVLVTIKDTEGKDIQVQDSVPGPKHDAFMKFVNTLPADRKTELFGAGGWDSRVVGRALTEFKAHEIKAATTQATQQKRIARGAVPATGSGRQAVQPEGDPIMQGWKNVKGKSPGAAAQHRGVVRR